MASQRPAVLAVALVFPIDIYLGRGTKCVAETLRTWGQEFRWGLWGWLRHRVSVWEAELQREATMSLNACTAMY